MKKRLVALVLAGTMALGMVGCGGSSDKSASKSQTAANLQVHLSLLMESSLRQSTSLLRFMTEEMMAVQTQQTTCTQSTSRRVCLRITT